MPPTKEGDFEDNVEPTYSPNIGVDCVLLLWFLLSCSATLLWTWRGPYSLGNKLSGLSQLKIHTSHSSANISKHTRSFFRKKTTHKNRISSGPGVLQAGRIPNTLVRYSTSTLRVSLYKQLARIQFQLQGNPLYAQPSTE